MPEKCSKVKQNIRFGEKMLNCKVRMNWIANQFLTISSLRVGILILLRVYFMVFKMDLASNIQCAVKLRRNLFVKYDMK